MQYYVGNYSFDSKFLKHHGIAGMKWGQRNGPPYPLTSSQKTISEKKREYDPDYVKAHSKNKIQYMSTKELIEVNNRLNQEQLYKKLIQNQTTGKKIIDDLIGGFRKYKARDNKQFLDIIKVGSGPVAQAMLKTSGYSMVADILALFGPLVRKK